MKPKTLLILIALVCVTLFLQSCTKSCTCENPSGQPKEIEIDPSESCSAYSDSTWSCS